jgi:hypothetical protein
MGDRVLFIVHNKSAGEQVEYSPVIYGHNAGYKTAHYLDLLRKRMASRMGDVSYAAARLVGIIHEETPGNLSLGIWNLPEDFEATEDYLTEMSHGDAGVVLYDCVDGTVQVFGSYYEVDAKGNMNEKSYA